jgi:hypothetical protein
VSLLLNQALCIGKSEGHRNPHMQPQADQTRHAPPGLRTPPAILLPHCYRCKCMQLQHVHGPLKLRCML